MKADKQLKMEPKQESDEAVLTRVFSKSKLRGVVTGSGEVVFSVGDLHIALTFNRAGALVGAAFTGKRG